MAAICYAWLLQNREEEDVAVIPVVNIERGRMNKHEEAAWLLFHVGIDASALLFADEVLDLLFLYSITCVLECFQTSLIMYTGANLHIGASMAP